MTHAVSEFGRWMIFCGFVFLVWGAFIACFKLAVAVTAWRMKRRGTGKRLEVTGQTTGLEMEHD